MHNLILPAFGCVFTDTQHIVGEPMHKMLECVCIKPRKWTKCKENLSACVRRGEIDLISYWFVVSKKLGMSNNGKYR